MAIEDATMLTLGRMHKDKAVVLLQGMFTGWSFSAKGRICELSGNGATFKSYDGSLTLAFNLDVKGVVVKFLQSSEIPPDVAAMSGTALLKNSAIKIEVPSSAAGSATGMLSLIELKE